MKTMFFVLFLGLACSLWAQQTSDTLSKQDNQDSVISQINDHFLKEVENSLEDPQDDYSYFNLEEWTKLMDSKPVERKSNEKVYSYYSFPWITGNYTEKTISRYYRNISGGITQETITTISKKIREKPFIEFTLTFYIIIIVFTIISYIVNIKNVGAKIWFPVIASLLIYIVIFFGLGFSGFHPGQAGLYALEGVVIYLLLLAAYFGLKKIKRS